MTGLRQTRSAHLDGPRHREDPRGADLIIAPTFAERPRSSPSNFSCDLDAAVLGIVLMVASESVVWADLRESLADQLEAARHAVLRVSTPISGCRSPRVEILPSAWGGGLVSSWSEEYEFATRSEDTSDETVSLVHLATTGVTGAREVKAIFEDED